METTTFFKVHVPLELLMNNGYTYHTTPIDSMKLFSGAFEVYRSIDIASFQPRFTFYFDDEQWATEFDKTKEDFFAKLPKRIETYPMTAVDYNHSVKIKNLQYINSHGVLSVAEGPFETHRSTALHGETGVECLNFRTINSDPNLVRATAEYSKNFISCERV